MRLCLCQPGIAKVGFPCFPKTRRDRGFGRSRRDKGIRVAQGGLPVVCRCVYAVTRIGQVQMRIAANRQRLGNRGAADIGIVAYLGRLNVCQ